MRAFLETVDFFSYQPVLYFDGKNRYQTIIGGILTILFISIILTITSIILKDLLKNDVRTVIYSKDYNFDKTILVNKIKILFYLINTQNEIIPQNILKINPVLITEKKIWKQL